MELRAPKPDERDELLRWLDHGLRGDRPGRLQAEYRVALEHADPAAHSVAWIDGRPAAHAFAHCAEAVVRGRRLPIGLIGNVYTAADQRGLGLGRACVEDAVRTLAARGAALALLWSELDDFYAPLGFQRAGGEWQLEVDAESLARALQNDGASGQAIEAGAAADGDWPCLEVLHASQPSRFVRSAGSLRLHASAPDCELWVARRGGRPVAYSVCGRGDDFPDVVHEWAGSTEGVTACIAAHLRERQRVGVIAGPILRDPMRHLLRSGARGHRGDLGLVRCLDPARLWRAAVGSEPALGSTRVDSTDQPDWVELETSAGRTRLDHQGLLALVLGIRGRRAPRPSATAAEHDAMHRCLPWPLFAWGFDSV